MKTYSKIFYINQNFIKIHIYVYLKIMGFGDVFVR